VEKGYEEIAKYLLDWRADPDVGDELGLTCLHKAAKAGSPGMCRLLLSNGKCDVNKQAKDWSTPLHLAVDSGCFEAVELLLDADAQVNVHTDKGFTPLHR
jgi:ankyrin repeat protein